LRWRRLASRTLADRVSRADLLADGINVSSHDPPDQRFAGADSLSSPGGIRAAAGGWLAKHCLDARAGVIFVVPLAVAALFAPAIYLPTAYAHLDVVSTLPPNTRPLDISAESLTIEGYQLITDVMTPDDILQLKYASAGSTRKIRICSSRRSTR